MAALEAHLSISLTDFEPVKALVAEADMAAQILASEEGDVVQAVREGLEAALDNLTPKE